MGIWKVNTDFGFYVDWKGKIIMKSNHISIKDVNGNILWEGQVAEGDNIICYNLDGLSMIKIVSKNGITVSDTANLYYIRKYIETLVRDSN